MTFHMNIAYSLTILCFVSSCVPVSSPQSSASGATKVLQYSDHVYEPNIKSVRIFRASQRLGPQLIDDVLPLGGSDQFVLAFDEINADYKEYFVKYIPCNADWTPAKFNDLQIIRDFNEFRVVNYEYSINTYIPYTTYSIQLPKVRRAGNYLILVYRDSNIKNIVLTKRVAVTSKKVQVAVRPLSANGGSARFTDHRIEFQISHPNIEFINPRRDIKVVIRQNRRWDNTIKGLQPTAIRQERSSLEYYHFDKSNRFPSPREYRFFDIRTYRAKGRFIDKIMVNERGINVFLYPDQSRKGLAYKTPLQEDLNGNYFIQNHEIGSRVLESQYANINFFVPSETKKQFPIYVVGAFNMWDTDNNSVMTYDSELKGYRYSTPLKQGYYNYAYVSNNVSDPYPFDGAHFEGENEYEIFVYFKEPVAIGDELIGYERFVFNRR